MNRFCQQTENANNYNNKCNNKYDLLEPNNQWSIDIFSINIPQIQSLSNYWKGGKFVNNLNKHTFQNHIILCHHPHARDTVSLLAHDVVLMYDVRIHWAIIFIISLNGTNMLFTENCHGIYYNGNNANTWSSSCNIHCMKQPCNMWTNDDDNNRNVCMTVVHAIDFQCILAVNLIKMSARDRKMPNNCSRSGV